MPRAVRVRVAIIILASAALCGAPWLLPGVHPALAALLQGALVAIGLYVGWCLWPRWTLGIAREQMSELPAPAGQPVRLTFDDGPTPGLTDPILDLLKEHDMKASFFVLLDKARANPHLIRRIIDEGHLLGLHGADHRTPFFRGADELTRSLREARIGLEAVAGQPILHYRPSHGWKNAALVRAARRAGLCFSFWDHGVWDTDAPPASLLLERLRTLTPPLGQPQPMVLFHDGLGDDPSRPAHGEALLAALGQWLKELRAGGRPAPQHRRRTIGTILPNLLGLGLLAWFFRSFDGAGFAAAVGQIQPAALLGMVIATSLSTLLQGQRFGVLFPAGLRSRRHVLLAFALNAGNILLPFRGGELIRPFYLKRWDPKLSIRALVRWSILDRLIEVIAFIPVVALSCVVFASDERFAMLRKWVALGGTAAGAAAALYVGLRVRGRLRWVGSEGWPAPGRLGLVLAISGLMWGVNYLLFYAAVPDLRLALALLVAVNVSMVVPSLPAGIGTYEAAFLWVGRTAGMPHAQVLAAALVSHAVQILVTLVLGAPVLMRWGWPEPAAQGGARLSATTPQGIAG